MNDAGSTHAGLGDADFSDADAQEILRRAIEIEKEGRVSASKLREIAAEAQIDPAALDRALAEVQNGKLRARQPDDAAELAGLISPNMVVIAPQSMSWKGWALVFVIVAITLAMVL